MDEHQQLGGHVCPLYILAKSEHDYQALHTTTKTKIEATHEGKGAINDTELFMMCPLSSEY